MEFLLLAVGGVLAGITNSLTGGGSLVSLPILMLFDLSSIQSIATNRFAIIFLSTAAAYSYHKQGHYKVDTAIPIGLTTGAGAIAGAFITVSLSAYAMNLVVLLLVYCFAIYLFVPKNILNTSDQNTSSPVRSAGFFLMLFGLGIYGGFIGVSVSTMTVILLKKSRGYSNLKSFGINQISILILSVTASAVFFWKGVISFSHAAFLAVGMAIGGYFGPFVAEKVGEQKLNILLRIMIIALAIRFTMKVF
ncbi:MAG: sulfite exporter TauE/SafE family protein [Candidatus Lindowbacteria bacterium]|nr:sulfite exporter TauE/SafE family protein [Candidatus Lindowbacteria bacterium]